MQHRNECLPRWPSLENNEHIHPADPAAASVLRLMASRQLLGHIHSWEIPPIADQLLSSGVYSDAIFEISVAKDAPMSDLVPLLKKALGETDVPWPTLVQAGWIVARHYITDVSESQQSPTHPLARLNQLAWDTRTELQSEGVIDGLDLGDLLTVYWSYGEPIDRYCDATNRTYASESEKRAALDAHARKVAREWLERHPE